MNTTVFDVREAESELGQLLALALKGSDIVIAKDNIPMVRLIPVELPKKRRTAGLHMGAMRMHEDFNAPLPDEFWIGTK